VYRVYKRIQIFDHHFNDVVKIKHAFTHTSYCNENLCSGNYEKLETMGDAVLKLIQTDVLFASGNSPGQITKMRNALESNQYLASVLPESLEKYIRVGKSVNKKNDIERH